MKWDGRLWQVLGICGLASAGSLIVVGCVQGPRVNSARFWDRKAAAVDEQLAEDEGPSHKEGPLSRKSLSAKSLAARAGAIHDERDPFAAHDAESKAARKADDAGVARVSKEEVAGRVPPATPSGDVVAPYIRKRTPTGALENDKHNAEIVRTDRPRSKELYPSEQKSASALRPQSKPLPHPSTQVAAAKPAARPTASAVASTAAPAARSVKRSTTKAATGSEIDRQLADIRASIAEEESDKPKATSRLASSHDGESASPAVRSAVQFVEEGADEEAPPRRAAVKRAAAQPVAKQQAVARSKPQASVDEDPFAALEAASIKASPAVANPRIRRDVQEAQTAAKTTAKRIARPEATQEDPAEWGRDSHPRAELTEVEPSVAAPEVQPRRRTVTVIPDRTPERHLATPIADTIPTARRSAASVASTVSESMIVDSTAVRGRFADSASGKSTSFTAARSAQFGESAEQADASAGRLAATQPTNAALDAGKTRPARGSLASAAGIRVGSKPANAELSSHHQTHIATSVEQGWTAIEEPAKAAKQAAVAPEMADEKLCESDKCETRAARATKTSHKRDRGEAWFILGMATGLGASIGLWFHLRRRPATIAG